MKADLHTHSTISDGSDTISQLIEAAKAKGLDAIAITDHDTTSHFSRVHDYAVRSSDIQVVAGLEISAIYSGPERAGAQSQESGAYGAVSNGAQSQESGVYGAVSNGAQPQESGAYGAVSNVAKSRVHVLGYCIKKPELITALTLPLLEARGRNSEKQAETLIRLGFDIDMEKISRADGKYLYKSHIMSWLFSTGQVDELFGEFYRKTFRRGGVCESDIEYIDVFEAVRTIRAAGGLAVLAHPGQQQIFWLIPELVDAGLCGLELNHHSHTDKDREIIRDYASRYGLFLTGGSDHHGKFDPKPFGVGDIISDESGAAVILGNSA